jgi:hypothetical protein
MIGARIACDMGYVGQRDVVVPGGCESDCPKWIPLPIK